MSRLQNTTMANVTGKCDVNCHSQDARGVREVHLISWLASEEHCPYKDRCMFPVCSRTKQDK